MLRGRFRPSPAMVVAFAALFVAVGGTSYAVTKLPANSVGAKQLRRGAVRTTHLASNAVTGAKVKNRSLTAADINAASLTGVASAANATHAGAAGALDRVTYVSAPGATPAAPAPDPMGNQPAVVAGASATCPAGTFAIGGGVGVVDNQTTSVVDSFPEPGGHAWTARVDNNDPAAGHPFTVVAVCVAAATAG
jgi:hypothetical protein